MLDDLYNTPCTQDNNNIHLIIDPNPNPKKSLGAIAPVPVAATAAAEVGAAVVATSSDLRVLHEKTLVRPLDVAALVFPSLAVEVRHSRSSVAVPAAAVLVRPCS